MRQVVNLQRRDRSRLTDGWESLQGEGSFCGDCIITTYFFSWPMGGKISLHEKINSYTIFRVLQLARIKPFVSCRL